MNPRGSRLTSTGRERAGIAPSLVRFRPVDAYVTTRLPSRRSWVRVPSSASPPRSLLALDAQHDDFAALPVWGRCARPPSGKATAVSERIDLDAIEDLERT